VYNAIVDEMTRADGEATTAVNEHVWLVGPREGPPAYEVMVFTTEGPKVVKTLVELMDGLQRLGEPGRPYIPPSHTSRILC
jgi:hypothetical protein